MDLLILIMLEFMWVILLVFYIKTLDSLSFGKWLLICVMLGFITLAGTCILSELGIVSV